MVEINKKHQYAPSTWVQQQSKYSLTHHHMKGAFGYVLSPKADRNDIFPRFWGCVVNVKGPIVILHHIHVQLHPLGRLHLTGHLAFPCRLCIHCNNCILAGLQLLKVGC